MRSALTLALGLLLVLTGCAAPLAEAPAPRPSATPSPSASGVPVVRVAVVGDSLSAALSTDFPNGGLDPAGWVAQALDERYRFAGGWAVWGATTADMRASVGPVDADVLVILAGTNDVALGVPFESTAANVEAIARTVGPERVVVVAIPPFDPLPAAVEPFNANLERFVRSQGWEWVEPVAALGADGVFRPGMSYDGIHFTQEGAAVLAEAIRSALDAGGERP